MLVSGRAFVLRASLVLSAMLFAGCAASPVARMENDVPVSFKEATPFVPAVSVPVSRDPWWRMFGDDTLNLLQTEMDAGSLSIRMALAQYRAARAALDASKAALSPAVGIGLSAARADSPTRRAPENEVTLGATASWELDLWGRVGLNNDAAKARAEASEADVAAVRLSLQAALLQTYVALRAAEAQEALLKETVRAYGRSLEMTHDRFRVGVVSSADVAQARSQFKSAQAQQVEQQRNRGQLEHALAVLVGKPPASFTLQPTARLPDAPEVPQLLPSTLLQRRPDIAAAERRVTAASAQVGAARRAFFPAVTLSADGGYRSNTVAQLISVPSLFWSIGPSVALAALDGGARRAAVESAEGGLDQSTASYRQLVLSALQEVEDNLIAASTLNREADLLGEALVEARKALELATHQYKAGTISYLSVATAQAAALGAERSLIEVRTRLLIALGQLAKNAGGSWGKGSAMTE